MKYLTIIPILLILASCSTSKNRIPKVNNEYERFEPTANVTYEQDIKDSILKYYTNYVDNENKKNPTKPKLILDLFENGSFILCRIKNIYGFTLFNCHYNYGGSVYTEDYRQDSLFYTLKQYRGVSSIEEKGVYCIYGFKVGKWYKYPDPRTVITHDYDRGLRFNAKKVIAFCKKRNIALQPMSWNEGRDSESNWITNSYTGIDDNYIGFEHIKPVWRIKYRTKYTNFSIILNGNTGKIVGKELVFYTQP